MRRYHLVLLIFVSICISCKENAYIDISEDIRKNIGADQLSISESKDSILIDIHYNKAPLIGFDFKSSTAALLLLDTTKSQLYKRGLRLAKVSIHFNQQVFEYIYPFSELEINKNGMETAALFLQNFLSSQNEQNARYVDLDKISLEDLFNLNQINEQLQSNLKLTSISFDGYTLHQSEPHNIEYRGNFQGDTEAIPFVFQYDKTLKRIFYFGINE
jgi:hypothetical protein